jgi:hypothetical protein
MAKTEKKVEDSGIINLQPGSVIKPEAAAPPTPQAPVAAAVPQAPVPPTVPEALTETEAANQIPTGLKAIDEPEIDAGDPGSDPGSDADAGDDGQAVSWTASEFVAHEKSVGWYLALLAAGLAVAAIVFLLTRDIISVVVVVVSTLLLGIYGARQPRQLEYRLDKSGVSIGQKYHGYDEFRSFMVMPEGAFSSIVFMPLKRFAPPLAVYYAPDDEDKIVNMLADQLPLEEGKRDAVDHLLHRIRF